MPGIVALVAGVLVAPLRRSVACIEGTWRKQPAGPGASPDGGNGSAQSAVMAVMVDHLPVAIAELVGTPQVDRQAGRPRQLRVGADATEVDLVWFGADFIASLGLRTWLNDPRGRAQP